MSVRVGAQPGDWSPRSHHQRGQATVELALLLPVVAVAMLLIAQAILVGHDALEVADGAREVARAAAADPSVDVEGIVARRLAGASVTVRRDDGLVRATVKFRSDTSLPLIGPLVPDIELARTVTMRDEQTR